MTALLQALKAVERMDNVIPFKPLLQYRGYHNGEHTFFNPVTGKEETWPRK